MTQINWGLAQGGGFQNALATGLQFGDMMRQRQQERETKNALAAYGTNPNEETLGAVMQADPRLGIELRGDMQAQQAKQAEADLTQRVLAGDPDALTQLATVNFDKWKVLSAEQKAATAQETKLFGELGLELLNTPPEQRQAKAAAYAQQFGGQYPDIMQVAQLPPDQLELALRGAVAEAGMVQQMLAMEQPKYMAIPEGGTLVDTRNPQAVQQFGAGMAPAPQQQQTGSGGEYTFEQVTGALQTLGPQKTAEWIARNGITVRVNSPAEARQLPSGTRILLPDGTEGRVP